MSTSDQRKQASLLVHDVVRGVEPRDAVQAGVADAAEVLKRDQAIDLVADVDARDFARAVTDMVRHRDAGGLDFSESSRDVTRMVLASWSLDRMRDEALGRDVAEGATRYVDEVAKSFSGAAPWNSDRGLFDHHAYAMTRDAVLASASVPTEMQDGVAAWELPLLDRPSDAERGFEPIGALIGPTKGEMDDLVLEAFVDASNVRENNEVDPETVSNHSFDPKPDLHQGPAVDARKAFPGELNDVQKGFLAAEAWMEKSMGRPMRPNEKPMFDRALARAVQQDAQQPLDALSSARMILLDASIQRSAWRAAFNSEYGQRTKGPREAFDDVIAASAGMDLHPTSIAPAYETTMPISSGRFASIPDKAIAGSIADGLKDARESYSPTIDRELRRIIQSGEAMRNREMAGMEMGAAAFARPESISKGPESQSALLGAYVTSSRSAGRD